MVLHEQAARARQARAGSGPERWMEQQRAAKVPSPPVDLVKADGAAPGPDPFPPPA